MMQVAITKGRRVGVREVSILELLDWAFRQEKVSIEFDAMRSVMPGQMPGFGMEWVMIERARLGCRVDGGGSSPCHPDADAVADALAQLPEACGGRSMALNMAELARAGQVPEWGQGLRPQCVPVAWQRCKHGDFAKTESAGTLRYVSRGIERQVDVRFCPVTIRNDAGKLASLRRSYLLWWSALREVRDTFRLYGGLTAHRLTLSMPPAAPWKEIP